MLSKRKHPFSLTTQSGRKNPRLNSRFRKKDRTAEKEELFTDLSNPSSLPPCTITRVRKKVEENIEHGRKLVFRALKKAKGFEKQKLVKRLKIARENNEDSAVKKLELEFGVLKTDEIDLNYLALDHILKTLCKSKPISVSPLFPPWFVSQKEPGMQLNEREIARMNIIARLYNSNPVKGAMFGIIRNVKTAMGMDEEIEVGEEEIKMEQRMIGDNENNSNIAGDEYGKETAGTVLPMNEIKIVAKSSDEGGSRDTDEEEWGGIVDQRVPEDSEMDLDAFVDNFEDRLARSSDECEDEGSLHRITDDEWSGDDEEQSEGGEGGNIPDAKSAAKKTEPELKPKAKSKDRSEDVSASKSKKSKQLKAVSTAESIFLPTLMSGYISGSDSDIDADYYKGKNGKEESPMQSGGRKNRMGQQARRALWEKKFGKDANHVKKGEEEQSRKKIEQRIKQGRGDGGVKNKRSEFGVEKKGKSTAVEGPLHPSWEAARKAKEQQAKVQEAVMGKPMGKKIVFS